MKIKCISFLTYISGMANANLSPFVGGDFHSKFGIIQIRDHQAMNVSKLIKVIVAN